MSKTYYRTPQMFGQSNFICHNCGKVLAKRLSGSAYEITLVCRRCHAETTVRCQEPIPMVENRGVSEDYSNET